MIVTAYDFDLLTNASMEWSPFVDQVARFEKIWPNDGIIFDSRWRSDWARAYWVGDQWATVLFARSFLDSIGETYEVVWDLAENPDCQFVILTNYVA
jgi:hypothetical protein